MWFLLQFLASPEITDPVASGLNQVVTSVVSATVISAFITGVLQFWVNKRNSRITERKNAVDEQSDVVARYKEQASEERAQKESAVRTIKELLAESKEQALVLKSTVETLTGTIKTLETVASNRLDLIVSLTEDRDRANAALMRAQEIIESQKIELKKREVEMRDWLSRTKTREEAERIVSESFGFFENDVQ